MLQINGEKWAISYVRGGEVVELERIDNTAYITLCLKDGQWVVSSEGIPLSTEIIQDLGRIFQINPITHNNTLLTTPG